MASEAVVLPDQLTAVQHVEETSPNVPITESQERTEDNKIHQPAVEKVDDSSELAAPAQDSALVTEDTISKPVVSPVSELPVADVGKETEGQTEISDASKSAAGSVEIPLHSPPTLHPGAEVETKPKYHYESKVVDKPESVAEEPQFGKEPEESEYKEVENSFSIVQNSEIGKNFEVAELHSKVVEKTESVVEAQPEPQKQFEDVESTEKKHEKFEPEESIGGKLAADEGILISKDDATESTTKRETGEDQEPFADKSSDALVSETPSDPIDKDVSIIPDALAEASQDKAQKDDIWSDTVENFSKGASLEVTKAEEEKSVKVENLAKPETTTAEDAGDENPATENPVTEVSEKSFEGLKAPGEVEIDTEEKKGETVKDDTADPVKTVEDTEPIASKPEEGSYITSGTEVAEKPFEALNASKNVEVVTEEKKEENLENDIIPQASEDKEVDYSNSSTEVAEKKDENVEVAEEKDENVKDDSAAPVETIDGTEPMTSKTEEGAVDTTSATEVTKKFVDELKASKDVEVTEEKVEDVKSNSPLAEIIKDMVPQSSEPKEVDYSNSAVEVAEKSIEVEKASADDVATKEKKHENVKDYSLVDSAKDTVLDGETNVSSTIDRSSGEPRELVLEPRENDVAECREDKITKEAEVAETTPSFDTLNLESSTETNDSKTTEDQSKQEVPTKSVQKHSHGILSKVKHSIGKVKKAITGKSPTSKNNPSDAKGEDVKVKEGAN